MTKPEQSAEHQEALLEGAKAGLPVEIWESLKRRAEEDTETEQPEEEPASTDGDAE